MICLLFFKDKKKLNVPADVEPETPKKSAIPPFSAGETVEFLDEAETHVPLAVSDIWYDKDKKLRLSLQRTPGMFTLPYMNPGDKATFYALPGGSRPVICTGVILSASRIKADLGDLSFETLENKRGEFRLSLSGPVILFDRDDQDRKNKFEATLANVSSGGLAFCTRKELAEGSIYGAMFRLSPGGPWKTYYGQIIWVNPLPTGRKMYGMIFSLLTQQEKDDLVSDIFKAQRNLRG